MTSMSTAPGRQTRTRVDLARAGLMVRLEEFQRSGRDRLPPESALSAELGVSRNTLREALAQLESEGLVERKRRVGTVITMAPQHEATSPAPRPTYPLDRIQSIPDFLEAAGGDHDVEWVTVRQETASPGVASALGLGKDNEVFHIRRKYAKDGVGVAIGEHWIPRVLRGQSVHIEGLTVGVSTYLETSQHMEIGKVTHTVSATTASVRFAHDLGVPIGSALLVVEARLQEVSGAEPETVALGSLVFNPAVVSLSATAELA